MAVRILPKDKTPVQFWYPAPMSKNFLQSEEWRKFQESVGHRTFNISGDGFWTNIIEHKLPIVGRYFYIPRLNHGTWNMEHGTLKKIIELAKKEKAGWIRVDVVSKDILKIIRDYFRPRRIELKIQKAPHDMQPRQVFIIDISKSEEELLADMKSKTRYNIKLSQKREVKISSVCHPERSEGSSSNITSANSTGFFPAEAGQNDKKKYIDEFLRLIKLTSKRKNITSHPDEYYRKMLEIPDVKLYAAEYQGKIIAANIIAFYDDTAIYLHGASDNKYRNVMAPFLLQWQAILDAKKVGYEKYDMGGIKMQKSKIKNQNDNEKLKKSQATSYKLQADWAGITRFKIGFSPETKPIEFLGSYDIILSPVRYWIYRTIRIVKDFIK